MRDVCRKALLLLWLCPIAAGCTPRVDDKARRYNEDGVELFAKGDYRNALDCFDLALTFQPQDPALIYNVAQCYDRLGNLPKAEQFYNLALERDPNYLDAKLGLVALFYRMQRVGEANRRIQRWLEEDPASPDGYVLDAWRLRQERALPSAQGRLQQALRLNPHHRQALTELAILYESMGMPDRALVIYERILEREPDQAAIAARLQQLKATGVQPPRPV